MVGRHHVVANAFALFPLTGVALAMGERSGMVSTPLVGGGALELVLGMGLFMLGALLPDADTGSSVVGRHVRLPGRHRTWTHSVWVVALLCLGGWYLFRPLLWLGLGWLVHLLMDSVSRAGICWLWPLTDCIRYGNGAFVARNHRVKLYRTGRGSRSELAVLVVWSALCLVAGVFVVLWWLGVLDASVR